MGLYYAMYFGSPLRLSFIKTQRKRAVAFGDSLTQLGNDPNTVRYLMLCMLSKESNQDKNTSADRLGSLLGSSLRKKDGHFQ